MEEFCVRDWNKGLNQEDIKESALTQYWHSDLYKQIQARLGETKKPEKKKLLKGMLRKNDRNK